MAIIVFLPFGVGGSRCLPLSLTISHIPALVSTKNLVVSTNIRLKVDIVIFFDYISLTYDKERGLRVQLKKWMLLNDIDRQAFTDNAWRDIHYTIGLLFLSSSWT